MILRKLCNILELRLNLVKLINQVGTRMILTYAVENFKGIGERQEIDFIATSKSEHSRNIYTIEDSNLRVNNGLCLIGPNGSGKSHMLQSLFLLSNMTMTPGKVDGTTPFILNKEWRAKPTIFEILTYDKLGKEFLAYELQVLDNKVYSEKLEVKPNRKNAKMRLIFNREGNNVTFGKDVKVSTEMINSTIDSGSTLLSFAKGINQAQIKSARTLVSGVFYFTPAHIKSGGPTLVQHVLYKSSNGDIDDKEFKEKNKSLARVSNLLREYGIRINKIELARSELNEVSIRFYPETVGDNSDIFYSFDEAKEFFSEGSFNTIVLVLVLFLVSHVQHILLLDEVDGSIHHKLALEIVDYVRSTQKQELSQFILSTHDIMLLDNDFRRDSIYTVIRQDNLESKLVRVSEFSVRKDSKLSQKYFSNEFGALPNIIKTSKYFAISEEKSKEG